MYYNHKLMMMMMRNDNIDNLVNKTKKKTKSYKIILKFKISLFCNTTQNNKQFLYTKKKQKLFKTLHVMLFKRN